MSKIYSSAEVARIFKRFHDISALTDSRSIIVEIPLASPFPRAVKSLFTHISPGISKIDPSAVQSPDAFQWTLEYERSIKLKALFVYGQWSGRYGYPPYLWLDKNFVFMWIQDVYPPIPTLSNLDLYFMCSIQNYYLLFL